MRYYMFNMISPTGEIKNFIISAENYEKALPKMRSAVEKKYQGYMNITKGTGEIINPVFFLNLMDGVK